MYAFAKLPAPFCPLQAPSLCTKQSLRSFCLAVTPQKSETLKQAIKITRRLHWLPLAVATKSLLKLEQAPGACTHDYSH